MVPQMMAVGEGETFRTVLDPSGCADERGLWQALTVVGLQAAVSAAEGGLDAPIARGWSAGERQLLALGRAILRKPAVLILDEPTSHLDDDAAERVLDTVRWGEALADTTVLVIAHRLADIAACERVLVIEDGKLQADGTPAQLLADSGSEFAALGSDPADASLAAGAI